MMQWFRIKKPEDPLKQFQGRWLSVYPTIQDVRRRTNAARVQVEHIAGNLTHQTCFQVNGSYLVSMLDAYSELNREPLPNQQMHEEFLSTVAEHVAEPVNAKPGSPFVTSRRRGNGQA